jgi:hypothetical protein
MKIYESYVVPEYKSTILDETICDLCGARAKNGEWDDGLYSLLDIEVSYTEGSQYPEGGYGTKYEVDICPECFKKKLIPWLENQGAEIHEEEWNN